MYIVYEYAICMLAVAIGVAMLIAGYVMSLFLIGGGRILAQTLHKLRDGPLSAARQADGG